MVHYFQRRSFKKLHYEIAITMHIYVSLVVFYCAVCNTVTEELLFWEIKMYTLNNSEYSWYIVHI